MLISTRTPTGLARACSPGGAGGAAARGFTLIELMVTLSILSLLLMLAVPSLTEWLRGTQVRTVASGLQSGLRTAQIEAQRRSRVIRFILTDDRPTAATDQATAKANGKYWATYTVAMDGTSETPELIDSGVVNDVAAGIDVTGPQAVCFSSLGRIIALVAAECSLPQSAGHHVFEVTNTQTPRRLRVMLGVGGQVRMCDHNQTLAKSPLGCA